MGFESLLGNRRIRDNLQHSLRAGRISHFYLISGPKGSGKHTLGRLLAAALLCGGEETPCLSCPSCRKVLSGTHPDVIWVDEPEKKTVSVALIRRAREDLYIRPNEAERKIYLFPRAQDMTTEAQNALLKVLEEPPGYGVFLLLTDNPEKLLPTVRSRCTELSLQSLDSRTLENALQERFPQASAESVAAAAARSGGFLGQGIRILSDQDTVSKETRAFANAFAKRNILGILGVLIPMEKWKRDALTDELQRWTELLEEALRCRCGFTAVSPAARVLGQMRSAGEFTQAIACLKKAMEYAQGNVSPAAVCGYLQWALRI